MSILTFGGASVTPAIIHTDLGLDSLRSALIDIGPQAVKLMPGWGSVGDPVDQLKRGQRAQPQAGRAALSAGDEVIPERLEARAYWWRIDTGARRASGDIDEATVLEATDVLISAWDDGQLLALISSRANQELATAKALLEKTLGVAGDDNGWVSFEGSALFELPSDFFLWAASRAAHAPDIGYGLLLDGLDTLTGQDPSHRTSVFGDGVRDDRPEVLAMIALSGEGYGPAKMAVVDQHNQLRVNFTVWPDGSFRVFKTGTESDDRDHDIDDDAFFLRVVMLFAYDIHPRVRSAFSSDLVWIRSGRTDFVHLCATRLRDATLRALGEA